MKYIRTKDGIFEVIKEDGDWLEIISNFERKMQCHCAIKKHAVIKQADTIPELCDEFIYVKEDIKKIFDTIANREYKLFKNKKSYWEKIYGAIWTDKGLIYAAKMSEKGELELL